MEENEEFTEEDLREGAEHEAEHSDIAEWLREEYGVDVDEEELYSRIAAAHLREEPDYYIILEDAGL